MPSAADILEPTVTVYEEAFNNGDHDKVIEFYHPESVVVQQGKNATYGKDNILTFFKSFGEMMGKSETKITDKVYEGSENYISYSAKFESETEKMGTVKGGYLQVWKKEGGKWLIIYDIFESS